MKSKMPYIFLIMLAAFTVLSLFLLQGGVQAGTILCDAKMTETQNDNDNDGFTDYQECLWSGQTSLIDNKNKIYGALKCPGVSGNPACATGYTCHCLAPNIKDLFLIILSASGKTGSSIFPSETEIKNYLSTAGLNINNIVLHTIYPAMTPLTRTVASGSSQNAIMITDSTDTSTTVSGPDLLGFANLGTPNGLDNTTIYTTRIKNFITNTCGTNYAKITYCKDNTGTLTGDALTKQYILHTIAHEVGHVLGPLSYTYNANYGGNHNATGANYVMDQSVYFTQSKGVTTFYIGKAYFSDDLTHVTLK
jgi:hypothetical protein